MWVKQRITPFDMAVVVFFVLASATFIYPLVMTLATSFSDPVELGFRTGRIWPIGFSLDSYKMLLADGRIMRYYLNTILYAVSGTIIMLFCTSLMAYPLTFRDFRGKTFFTIALAITMFFSGGLVPFYLVVLTLGLMDTMWALILPGAIAAWNVFIFRTFFFIIMMYKKICFFNFPTYFFNRIFY